MAKMLKMNNGLLVPSIGLGTWKATGDVLKTAYKYAIEEAGYRHFDTSFVYENEEEIGNAIKEAIGKGILKREEFFITTKLWCTHHSRKNVIKCCKESLSKLDIGYIDLFLIHWPMAMKENSGVYPTNENGDFLFSDIDYIETWQGMEDCVNAGLVKSIGLSNFNSEQIKRVIRVAKVKPVMNQVECHPYINQTKLIEFCKSHDILVTAYSPLGSPTRPWASPEEPLLLEDPKLKEIASKQNKSTAQILIKYQIQRGVGVIPRSVTPSRILSNIQVFDFELSDDEMKTIDSFDRNYRFIEFKEAENHKYYPFSIPF